MRIDGPQITGSFSLNGDGLPDLDILATTSSLNSYTSSINTTMGHVMTSTHSLNTFTSSASSRISAIESSTSSLNSFSNSINSYTSSNDSTNTTQNSRLSSIEGKSGSYATTGSNTFVGTQTIQGSIVPSAHATYDLGSAGYNFRHLYLSSASLYIDGTKVLGSTTQELQITTDNGQSFKILEAGSDTITLQSADGNITLATSGGGDVILDPTTGIIALKGTTQVYAGNKVRSSDGNNIVFGDGLTVSGSVTITGFIEAQELRTTYISSSILYRSGSTKFGDELSDTHAFTGSLLVSGSISVPGSGLISGSSQILNGSGVWSGSAQLPSGVVSGSAQIDVMSTTNIGRLATTGSNTFTSNQTVTGSLSVSGSAIFNTQQNFIVSSSSTGWVVQLNNQSNIPTYIGIDPNGPYIQPASKGVGIYNGSATKYLYVTSSGVGINKLTPNADLDVSGTAIVSGSAFTLFGGASTSDTVNSNITAANGAAAELVIRGGDATTNRRAAIRFFSNQISTSTAQWILGASMTQSAADSKFYLYNSGGTATFTATQDAYLGINRTDPAFYLDVYANVANSFYTIAQFENRDYTAGTRSFIRVRNWLSAGGSYSSYFGQGQDGKTYIIANNSARGGDVIIDGSNGYVGIGRSPSYLFDVNGGSAFRDTLRILASDVNAAHLSWTSTNTGLLNLYHGGALSTQILASGLSFFNGSIRINQDAALRAGSNDNWIIGQDSGTNVIHIGSTAVANDIRFDSSTGTGIAIIKANARLGVNTTDPATTFDVNGYMGLRSNNYFYFGHTTSNIGGWTTRMYANGATHMFNANGFTFNNEGYGSATWLTINSSGNVGINVSSAGSRLAVSGANTGSTPLVDLTASGTGTFQRGVRLLNSGMNSGDHIMYAVGRSDNSRNMGQTYFYFAGDNSTSNRLSFGLHSVDDVMHVQGNATVTIGGTGKYDSSKLAVEGAVKVNRKIFGWYQATMPDGYTYFHMKTNMWAGGSPNGNIHYTMSLFYAEFYSYSAYIRSGYLGFHNWSGSFYNVVTTGNVWSSPYTSSDGYVVLVIALGSGSYNGLNVDWNQTYGYPFQDKVVTASSASNSATGVY